MPECQLCRKSVELRYSHVIPHFVFRWLKDNAASPLRKSDKPNVRVQDGPKDYLLCDGCEGVFNKWETEFSQKVFMPYHERSDSSSKPQLVRYGPWCLKFAVSVSWRVLLYTKERLFSGFPKEKLELVDSALATWRSFLLDDVKHPGQFEQHLLPLDFIESHTFPKISPFINRYIAGAVDLNVVSGGTTTIVYAKMCKIALFGLLETPSTSLWKGTKLHVHNGHLFGTMRANIPQNVAGYLNNQATVAADSLASMSDKQKSKVSASVLSNIDNFIDSQAFHAMRYDIHLSGDDAFRAANESIKSES